MPHVSYFWDEMEDNVVEEYDGDTGNTIATHTTEPTLYGSVLSQDRSGEKRYFQFDGLGNTTEFTNASGDVTDTRRYSAFGETTASSGVTPTPLGFGGRWGYHSSNSESFATIRRRTLPFRIGRWASLDPNERLDRFKSPYVYSANRPLARFDPSGLAAVGDECDDVQRRWPRKMLRCTPSNNVGIQLPGPCKILIVIGHNYPFQYVHLQEWLSTAIEPLRDCTGCGHWFGAVACCSKHLHNQFPRPAIVPGLDETTKFIGCNKMVDGVFAMLETVDAFAKRLCDNRSTFKDQGCPASYLQCGDDFAFCESVEVTIKCDEDARKLFVNAICPPPEDAPNGTQGPTYQGGKDLAPVSELCGRGGMKVWKRTKC